LVQQEPRVLLELLAQLELMEPQVLPELVLLELLVYKAQLGQVALPEPRGQLVLVLTVQRERRVLLELVALQVPQALQAQV
jgi:hypothetical protein